MMMILSHRCDKAINLLILIHFEATCWELFNVIMFNRMNILLITFIKLFRIAEMNFSFFFSSILSF